VLNPFAWSEDRPALWRSERGFLQRVMSNDGLTTRGLHVALVVVGQQHRCRRPWSSVVAVHLAIALSGHVHARSTLRLSVWCGFFVVSPQPIPASVSSSPASSSTPRCGAYAVFHQRICSTFSVSVATDEFGLHLVISHPSVFFALTLLRICWLSLTH